MDAASSRSSTFSGKEIFMNGRVRAVLSAVVTIAMGLGAAGCSEKPPAPLGVTGVVTLDGNVVQVGSIRFMPRDSLQSNVDAVITEGRYGIDPSQGLRPGKYKVEISAPPPTPAPKEDEKDKEKVDEAENKKAEEAAPAMPDNIIPAKYNAASELEVELSGSGVKTKDFPLESK